MAELPELEQLYKTYRTELYRYLCFLCRDPHRAEDLLSDTFLRALHERREVYSTALSGELQSVELDLCWTPEDPQGGAGEQADLFPLDAPFDPAVTARVPDRLCAQILWDGEPADADFEAVAAAFDAALTAAGYDIDYYDLTLVPRDAGHEELQALDLDRLIRK